MDELWFNSYNTTLNWMQFLILEMIRKNRNLDELRGMLKEPKKKQQRNMASGLLTIRQQLFLLPSCVGAERAETSVLYILNSYGSRFSPSLLHRGTL